MKERSHGELVLALYPFTRGIAFTLFEAPLAPIDWGVKDIRGRQRNALTFAAAKQLIERLQPEFLILQDIAVQPDRRAHRIRRLHRLIASYAAGEAIEVRSYSRKVIRTCFQDVGAATRYEIAQAIAAQIHAFGHRLPPARKLWNSEDARMSLFDAASLVMTFYYCEGSATETAEVSR